MGKPRKSGNGLLTVAETNPSMKREADTSQDEYPKRTRGSSVTNLQLVNSIAGRCSRSQTKKSNGEDSKEIDVHLSVGKPPSKSKRNTKKAVVTSNNTSKASNALDDINMDNSDLKCMKNGKAKTKKEAKAIQQIDSELSPKSHKHLIIDVAIDKKVAKVKDEPADEKDLVDNFPGPKSKQEKKSKTKKVKEEIKRSAIERSVVKKGLAGVDGLCPIAQTSHVYCEGDDIWDCMLNQTNIQFNNNKYYLIQLLKDDDKGTFSVWMRWGRVGCSGQNSLKPFANNLEKAKETFKKKFSDKTKNEWELRQSFEKVPGKYDLLHMDYSHDTVDSIKKEEEKPIVPRKKVESKLLERVKALVELICDVKAMEEAVIEMKYDAKKAPLGKLTVEQVKAGYAALKLIDDIISERSGKASNRNLLEACNAFYTRIPHYFGMKVPPLIHTKAEVQQKISLLQTLGDIQAAMSILCQPIEDGVHPADQHYNGLDCDIQPLEKNSDEYKMLEKYLRTTHGSTHSMYKMEIQEIFKVTKSTEAEKFKDYGNRMLLWHGSRLTNFAGILSKGLRIAPPEAPSTGYMFGKGIYFADMSSKSANYCMTSSVHATGLLILCDVSLGKWHTLLNANYNAHKLPPNHHSVKALGKFAPDSKNQIITSDNVIVPMGPFSNTQVNNKEGYTLQYNEYIVYDVNQVKIKYLFKIKFIYN